MPDSARQEGSATTYGLINNTLALVMRLPMIYSEVENVEAGALMSYRPNFIDLFRRAAELVDKILRGAKPSDFPVEQPTKFYLAINVTSACCAASSFPAACRERVNFCRRA
jgi:ABC-type uncharacterized transport system substrate-binding protein